MLVDLYLIDGNVLRNCNLYPENVKNGELPFISKDKIDQVLSKVPWGFKYVSFQTKALHGQIHVNNIERYELSGNITLTLGTKAKVIGNNSGHCFNIGDVIEFVSMEEYCGETTFAFKGNDGVEQGLYADDFEVL